MNRKTISEELRNNTYPGRGIIIGKSEDGENMVIVYFIMGRSVNSRNRVFIEQEGGIRTEASTLLNCPTHLWLSMHRFA